MKKAAVIIAVISAAVAAALLIYDGVFMKTANVGFFAMNTYVSAELKGADSQKCAQKISDITAQLDTEVLSRTSENSEIHSVNQNGSGVLGSELSGWIAELLQVCKKSGGAFDFTLGGVSDLWSFGSNPRVPDGQALADALLHSGYEKLTLSGNNLTLSDRAAVIDLGAAGKGIALDKIKEAVEKSRVSRAVVSVGGSVLLYGDKTFTVGIRDPEGGAGRYIAKLSVEQSCVSTSGSYEQSFEKDGRKYHHILAPETGYPVDNGLVSVTVISESGLLSDALSTACFVLGIERGSKLAAEYGCRAVFITQDKRIYLSGVSRDVIEITDNSYTFAEQ